MTAAKKNNPSDFTQGSMLGNIVRMAIPMTTALLINVLYSVVDRMYIGHIADVGRLALTGIGLAFPITTIITAFQNLFGSGGAPLFSIACGKGDPKLAGRILNNACFMLITSGVLLTVAAFLCKEPVLWKTGASPDTFGYANDYLGIYLLGTVFVLISLGLNPYINAQGSARTGMFTVLIGAVVNIVLDPLFIFVFDMGVKGAAIATVIAQGCSAVWVLLFLTGKGVPIRLNFVRFRPEPRLIGQIMGLGVTEFTFAITTSAVSMLYNTKLQRLGGDIWVSSMTVINSLREIVMMAIHGVTGASRPILGYNYGAARYDRVREGIRLMTEICVVYMLLVWGVIMLCPQIFIRIFNDDPVLIAPASLGIRLFFSLTFVMAFQLAGQNVFVALGKAKHALFFSLLRKVVLVIPLALLLPNLWGLGVRGIFLSEPISDLIGGAACYITMLCTVGRELRREEATQKQSVKA